jgi:hypothetical protein
MEVSLDSTDVTVGANAKPDGGGEMPATRVANKAMIFISTIANGYDVN